MNHHVAICAHDGQFGELGFTWFVSVSELSLVMHDQAVPTKSSSLSMKISTAAFAPPLGALKGRNTKARITTARSGLCSYAFDSSF